MPLKRFNPWNGHKLVTLNLTSAPRRCANYGFVEYCLHHIVLGSFCMIGKTSGIVRAYGFVGRVFQVTLEVY